MNDNDNKIILGEMRSDIKHILVYIETAREEKLKKEQEEKEYKELMNGRVGTLENWRNGLVIAWVTAVGIFTSLGVTLQKALATIIHP